MFPANDFGLGDKLAECFLNNRSQFDLLTEEKKESEENKLQLMEVRSVEKCFS